MPSKTATREKRASSRAEYSSPAVDKAVDVIEFLASQGESVSITSIAEGIDRSVGEIYRIVLALEHRRLISRDSSTDRLRLSLRLFELAHEFPPVERLIQVARAEMDTLVRKARQSCHLAVAEETEIVVVAARESPLPMRYSVRVGSSFDMFETSSGVVIAAFGPERQREDRLRQVPPEKRAALEARFESVRACGYEIRESETVDGLSNISVPVQSRVGGILGALTVPYLRQTKATMEPPDVLTLQLTAAERMRDGLG
ncbi:IclR family transcriptional regulator [Rhodobacteraceae bacterium CCMM004]|nr:IclR family transcriptional regulator [Rhodobacteraceae bacterium CCMM004]